jgi:hypothetical protein
VRQGGALCGAVLAGRVAVEASAAIDAGVLGLPDGIGEVGADLSQKHPLPLRLARALDDLLGILGRGSKEPSGADDVQQTKAGLGPLKRPLAVTELAIPVLGKLLDLLVRAVGGQ